MLALPNRLVKFKNKKVILTRFLSFLRQGSLGDTQIAEPQVSKPVSRLLGVVLAGLSLVVAPAVHAQTQSTVVDTVRLTLPDAEVRFVQNNLLLLAQRYNITAQQALAVQARLIDNPTILVDGAERLAE
jgi:hypothetical protein